MMNLDGARVVVVGLGKSGLSSVRLLVKLGAQVTANDSRDAAALGEAAAEANRLGATLAVGGHPDALYRDVDLIVVSPGVPRIDAIEEAAARGTKVIGEIELAAWQITAPIVGITGTNGKSTVTTLVGRMAELTGRPTFAGGNLGTPLADVAFTPAAEENGIVVAELSSFQLERIELFRAHVAVLLNVTDDHLDRYESFAAYAAAKGRIFHAQRSSDHAVVPSGDELCASLARAGRGALHSYAGAAGEVRVRDDRLVDELTGWSFALSDLRIRGAHNVQNACAAALTARLAGIGGEHVSHVLASFEGLAHRMVLVRETGGVAYFDDSKATNVGAAVAALDGLDPKFARVVLIAGGVDKGGSYAPLRARLEQRARAVVLLGAAAKIIARELEGSGIATEIVSTLDEAVSRAHALAEPGDAVLLAPACSSFDMFRSYAHRGDEFTRAVRALPEVRA